MKRIFVACGLAMLMAKIAVAQVELPEWEDVDIIAVEVAEGIYMIEGFGGNIGVLAGADGVILVDDQYAPLTARIKATLARLTDAPVRFVINTHWHADHTGGNENLGAAGAVIVAHDQTRTYMTKEQFNESLEGVFAVSPGRIPVVTFNDSVTFHLNGETVRAFHVNPAHTGGDVVVHFTMADVIHTGDAYFNGFYPFIDVDHGGSIDGMIAFQGRLLGLMGPETKVIPGHGPVAHREDVRAYREMLKTVRDRVATAMRQGTSVDDLIADEPLRDLDPVYGGNLIKAPALLRMVYRDLEKNGF